MLRRVIPVVESIILELRGDADVCVNPNVAIPPSTTPVWQPFDSCYLSRDKNPIIPPVTGCDERLGLLASRGQGECRIQRVYWLKA